MLVTAFGTSTAYAYWSFSLVGHVIDVVYGSHYRIHCLDIPDFRSKWHGRDGRVVLATSDRPEIRLTKLLTTSGFPSLAFVDEPDDAIADSMRINGSPLPEAIRFSTGYFCCLGEAFVVENVQMFGKAYYDTMVTHLISDIMKAILGEADELAIARVLERVAPDFVSASEMTVRELMARQTGASVLPFCARQQLAEPDKGLLRAVAEAYRPIFEKRELTLVEWPREMFNTANKGHDRPGEIELFGPARFLIWGPYMYLPPGEWRAWIEFEVVDNRSGNEIEADVCVAMRVIAKGRTILPVIGVFKFSLDFAVVDPNLAIELRVQMLRGAFEGKFGLRKVTLERIWIASREATPSALTHDQAVLAAH